MAAKMSKATDKLGFRFGPKIMMRKDVVILEFEQSMASGLQLVVGISK
jgi:hypothetical protein